MLIQSISTASFKGLSWSSEPTDAMMTGGGWECPHPVSCRVAPTPSPPQSWEPGQQPDSQWGCWGRQRRQRSSSILLIFSLGVQNPRASLYPQPKPLCRLQMSRQLWPHQGCLQPLLCFPKGPQLCQMHCCSENKIHIVNF